MSEEQAEVGNTGSPTNLRVALRGSFSARRGEFVRVPHTEREGQAAADCLGRIVGISRSNVLYSDALGEGVAEVNVLPGSLVSGETLYATVELIGFKDPATGEIRLPRRPLDPGAKVYGVDYAFLRDFYQFSELTSIHLGNLVGYESGAEAVPIYLDVNTLATEHLAVLAMTGSGKSYTVGRIIERLVAQMNGTVVVYAEGFSWLAEHFPDRRWYRFRAGVAMGLAGRYADAAGLLEALHGEGPASGIICAKLGFVHRQMGAIDLAIQYFNEALMLDEHEPVALSQMAELRAIQGRMDKAEQYLSRLERVEGADDEVRRLRRKLGK